MMAKTRKEVMGTKLDDNLISLLHKTPCIIKIRDGRLLFASKLRSGVIGFYTHKFDLMIRDCDYNPTDLTYHSFLEDTSMECYDIIKIYHPYSICSVLDIEISDDSLIWKREENV